MARSAFERLAEAGSWRPLGWLLAALVVAVNAWTLARYAVDFPNADDFSQLLSVPYYYAVKPTFRERLGYLFSLSVEHRIATMRLAALVQANALGALNFPAFMFFGAVLLIGAGSLVVAVAGPAYRPWLAAIAAALLCSPVNHEAQFWATGALQHFGVIAYAIAALYCLARSGPGWTAGAVGLALAASFTSANGLMTFPAGMIVLWSMGRRRLAVGWAGLAIIVFATYFVGYERPEYQRSVLGTVLDPVPLARFYFLALGSAAVRPGPALAMGAVLTAVWGWLLVARRHTMAPVLLGWLGFLLLSYAAMAIGRVGFGDEGALLSRYRVYSEIAILVTLVAVLGQVERKTKSWIVGVTVPLCGAWFVASLHSHLPLIAFVSIVHQNSLNHHAAEGQAIYDQWPPQEYGDFLLARAHGSGYYDATRAAHAARRIAADTRDLEALAPSPFRIERLTVGAHAVTVRGYVPDNQSPVAMWLSDGTRNYRAELLTLPGVRTPIGGDWGFFWGTVGMNRMPPGRYRMGYAMGGEASSTVYWTERWITLN